MKADTLTISGIIQRDTLLRIPYFQRRYVWGIEDWKRFARDMESTLVSVQKYFLGAIILKEEETTAEDRGLGVGKRFLIIDGQQRLTTLSIYMKVLHMFTNRNEDFARQYLQNTDARHPVLTHNCEDMPYFHEVMHLDTLKVLDTRNSIYAAYSFFVEYLKDARTRGVNLLQLLNTINASVTFVAITLDQKDDEQQIFDTINSLGVPLTTGELMKNFLYQANDEARYNKFWKPVFDVDVASVFWAQDRAKSRQAKGSKTSNIEIFFHAFVRIKMWDFKDRLDENQKNSFVKISNVFSTCKAFVEDFGMNRQDLADEIIAYAKLFRDNFDMRNLDESVPSYCGIKRIACLVNATKNSSVISYLLYILKNVDSESERNKIFGYVETYLIRRILAGSSNNSYSELFAESLINHRVLTFAGLKAYVESKGADAKLAMPSNEKVMRNVTVRNKSIDEEVARILYYMYESKIRGLSDAKIQGYNDYVAEMMMPKAGKNLIHWPRLADPDSEEERVMLIGTLGNCFLVDDGGKKELKAVNTEVFGKKVPVFIKWGNQIRCNQILKNQSHWDVNDINNRNKGLAKAFCDLFCI